jgi:hypothetical protein
MQILTEVTGWNRKLEVLSPADQAQFVEAVASAVQPHLSGGRVRLMATARCASASILDGPSID